MDNLKGTLKESIAAVLPITAIVAVLCFTVAPIDLDVLMLFVVGAVLLIVGMAFFTLGASMSMSKIGENVGAHIVKSRKLWLLVIIGFIVGFIITVAEPDLQVLAEQVAAIPSTTLIISVALGVAVFLVLALLRVVFRWPLKWMLIIAYVLIFGFSAFVPNSFIAVAFDSGGVTTGPMTVPFIMALGVGVSSVRSDSDSDSDSFGLVALSSVGPILTVLILGIVFQASDSTYASFALEPIADSRALWQQFSQSFPHYAQEVGLSLGALFVFYIIYQVAALHNPKSQVIRITVGIAYTFFGLVLFLTGANIGFMPAGNLLGQQIAKLPYNWIIVPIGMLIGYFIVAAEPAVHVLNKQVDEITEGAVPQKAMQLSLSIGVAASVGLAMIRVLTGISIYWLLIPGYAIALGLSFVVPKIFTSIAFDSGGVASGPMTATFLLAFAMGACEQVGGNIATDAFGIVAMVAMTPLITIQILGLYFKIKNARAEKAEEAAEKEIPVSDDEDVIELEDEEDAVVADPQEILADPDLLTDADTEQPDEASAELSDDADTEVIEL